MNIGYPYLLEDISVTNIDSLPFKGIAINRDGGKPVFDEIRSRGTGGVDKGTLEAGFTGDLVPLGPPAKRPKHPLGQQTPT